MEGDDRIWISTNKLQCSWNDIALLGFSTYGSDCDRLDYVGRISATDNEVNETTRIKCIAGGCIDMLFRPCMSRTDWRSVLK